MFITGELLGCVPKKWQVTLRIADGWVFIELPARQPQYNVITNV